MSNKKFKDDSYKIIENDIEKIRNRPSMYISSLGESGAFHICKEIIDNNYDECYKPDSPGDSIYISATDDEITTRDNGRGIPTNILRKVFETLQAGTNMERSGGMTRGENGAGSTCILAMSSYLKIISIRPNEKKKMTLVYEESILTDETVEDYNGDDHGLIVTFRPSKKVLGTKKIPINLLKNWLNDFTYTLPKNIDMSYTLNGKKTDVVHKSISDLINDEIKQDSRLCGILTFSCEGGLTETFMDKVYDRKFKADIALTYTDPTNYNGEDIKISWMNTIRMYDHGSHVDGVISGFMKQITERIVKKNKRLEGVDIKKDILSHLNIVINSSCDIAHMFASQAKHKVFNKELGKAIEKSVYEKLSTLNDRIMSDMVDVVIGNYRARIEGEKARDISRSTKESKKWVRPDSYIPHSSIKTNFPKELYLVEGNSAGGDVRQARDARYQAIYQARGKIPNSWDLPLDVVLNMENGLFLNIVKILGCGIGPSFDINKLKFDKIIISTDADIDGFHIRVGYMTFFVKWMPEIIQAGKLYIVEPPLYEISQGKKISYVATQMEYIEQCINSMGDMVIDFV